jgi:hypothetical protein
MNNPKRRIAKLEGKLQPQRRFIVAVCTPENQALVAQGFLPDPPRATAAPNAKGDRQRLGKRDIVVFLLEAEMALS